MNDDTIFGLIILMLVLFALDFVIRIAARRPTPPSLIVIGLMIAAVVLVEIS